MGYALSKISKHECPVRDTNVSAQRAPVLMRIRHLAFKVQILKNTDVVALGLLC